MVSQRQSTRPGPWLRGLFGVHRGPRQPGVSWCESSLPRPRAPSKERNRTITNPLLSLTLGGRPSKATGPGEQTKSRSECNLPFKEWCRLRLVIPGWAWLVPAGPGPGWSSWLVRVNLVGRWTLSWPVDVTKLYKWIGYGPRGLSQEISCRGAGRP